MVVHSLLSICFEICAITKGLIILLGRETIIKFFNTLQSIIKVHARVSHRETEMNVKIISGM